MGNYGKNYTPLHFLRKAIDVDAEFVHSGYGGIMGFPNFKDWKKKFSPEDTLKYLCSDDYLYPDCKEEEKRKMNEAMITMSQYILTPRVMKNITKGQANFVTEMRDMTILPILLHFWDKNKQVYKPDEGFASALIETDSVILTKDALQHLPANTFYIDLSDTKMLDPIIGTFVNVTFIEENTAFINIFLLTVAEEYFSFYTKGTFDENGICILDFDHIFKNIGGGMPSEYVAIDPFGKKIRYANIQVSRENTNMFCLLLLGYLTSKRPEITDNPVTKGTYRKPSGTSVPRQRWSEVEIHDVGVRYGTTLRAFAKSYKEEAEKENKEEKLTDEKRRKSPIPHFRRAHWQRYWVGKGRKTCQLEWIEPIFVLSEKETAKDVVIHRMTT
jgi:hypothetical protein